MKRMLSSRTTFFWKFVFPVFWLGVIGLITLWLFSHTIDPAGRLIPVWVKWQFVAMWMIGFFYILWLIGPLKRVFRDEDNLYIENYRTEISVPLSNIVSVHENRLLQLSGKNPITVEFVSPTVFGRKITFIPTGPAAFIWIWQRTPHPIAAELQSIIKP